jgi:hypothetical protein
MNTTTFDLAVTIAMASCIRITLGITNVASRRRMPIRTDISTREKALRLVIV